MCESNRALHDPFFEEEFLKSFNALAKLESELNILGLSNLRGPSIRKLYVSQLIRSEVISSKKSIILLGGSGTSKSFLAEIIAKNSNHPVCVTVNSKNPRADLKKALLSASNEPTTAILDEVYAMPKGSQEYCLVEFGRPGIKIRLISTSSTPYDGLKKTLKPDFLNRINDWYFELKPWKDSPADIEEAILNLVEEKFRMGIDAYIVDHLKTKHDWPNNYRGIQTVTEYLCQLCKGEGKDVINIEVLMKAKAEIKDPRVYEILKPLIE